MKPVTRRDFLKVTSAASLAAAAGSSLTFAAPAAAAPALNPFGRAGRPRLLLSLAAYSFLSLIHI